ncbi:MAG TPA: SDR family oxidoreductase [Thermoplasmata archaeon]|nr:SDR family oxidoreductase [Thermoplasmata archaeon]
MNAHPPADTRRQGIALVTGASRGLGETLGGFLAQEGFHLIATARGAQALDAATRTWRAQGGSVEALAGDVTDPVHVAALRARVASRGRLDLLVNNASELGPSPLVELSQLSLPELRRVFEVNVVAPLALVQQLLPWLERAGGQVVNVSSDAAVGAYPGWGGYGASKSALDLVSRTLAEELRGRGISVVAVDPGDMRTAMHQAASPDQDISDRPLPSVTLPFWAWLLHRDPADVSGQRFRAQSDRWEVPP